MRAVKKVAEMDLRLVENWAGETVGWRADGKAASRVVLSVAALD